MNAATSLLEIQERNMTCYNSITVDASANEVWSTLRDFHDMSWAAGVIENVEKVGPKSGVEVGASRVLNGAFHETLLELDDENMLIRYSIDDGPDALAKDRVQGYRGEVRVLPVTLGNGSFIEWSSVWASETGGVLELCDPVYQALLGRLKTHHA
jgi:Polyketide cyclase / dehydrase and lipid transport